MGGLWKGNLAGPYGLSHWGEVPVNLVDYPLHLVTIGWLFALLLVLPVLVGTLFGPKAGTIVALAGGLFSGLPLLFIVTVPAAYLAGTCLNHRLKLGPAVWLSAGLPFCYMVAVTVGGIGIAAGLIWLIVLAVMALHVKPTLYLIGRRDFQGTFLLKLLAVETVLLMGFFYHTVGFDVIEYECVRSRASCMAERFKRLSGPNIRGRGRDKLAEMLEEHFVQVSELRDRSIDEFKRFVSVFPRSRFTPLALYETAELHNMRLHVAVVTPLIIRIHTDRISSDALRLYERIIRDFNDSIHAAAARRKLAEFAAQHGNIDRAAQDYGENVINVYSTHLRDDDPPDYRPNALEIAWRTRYSDRATKQLAYYDVIAKARKRQRFIADNADYSNIPLVLYLQADPLSLDFLDRIGEVLVWFPSAKLVDNILWDRTYRTGLRLAALINLYENHPHGDMAPRVLLELAGRYLKRPYEPETAQNYYRILLSEFADSPEAERARTELGGHFKDRTNNPSGS